MTIDRAVPASRNSHAWSIDAIFASPSIVLAAFVVVPLVYLAVRGWQDGQVAQRLTSPFVLHAMQLSVVTSTITLVLALIFGVPAAYLLARSRFPGYRLLTILVELPLVLPPTVAGVALLVAFGRRSFIGAALDEAGISLAFSTTAVILAQLFVSAPFLVRALQAGFEAIDPTYEDISRTLGVSEFRTFMRVTLPLAKPALLSGSVLCWTRALSELGATLIFAGNFEGRTQTMPLAIITAFESNAGLSGAIALSLILLVAAFVLLLVARLWSHRTRGVV